MIHVRCLDCGDTLTQPDKGLGRAAIAAWRTRHPHSETTKTSGEPGAQEEV